MWGGIKEAINFVSLDFLILFSLFLYFKKFKSVFLECVFAFITVSVCS